MGEVAAEVRGSTTTPPRYQNLCGDPQHSSSSASAPNSSSCCPSSILPYLVHSRESNLLLTTFNNSFKYTTFKTQITAHLQQIREYERGAVAKGGNRELWNATVEGLNVLREWGVKYWDPLYLYRNRIFAEECLRRVAQNSFCYACGGGTEVLTVKPCKSLCHNTVVGCLKSPLAEYIESPWKHAVNSVRTAVRLVMTTGGESSSYGVVGGKQDTNHQPLQDLVNDLNDWREPITWWLDEYKSSRTCEGLPSTNCWNGESVGRYDYSPVTWRSSYNPEFTGVSVNGVRAGSRIDPVVTVELDKFRNELVYVRRTLEKFWPTTSSPTQVRTPLALPLSSMEDRRSPASHLHSLTHYEGSGGEAFESDDEDLEYNNSGYGPHIPSETDDEDLIGGEYGSGSGDGEDGPFDKDGGMDPDDIVGGVGKDDKSDNKKDRPPVSLSGVGRAGGSGSGGAMFALLVILWHALI